MKQLIYKVCVLLFSWLCNNCQKATDFASIYGVVRDATGSPIENAHIVLNPSGADESTKSNGYFEFNELDPQQYTLTVSMFRYKTEHEFITVYPNEKKEKNIVLKELE
ncbi:MAG: carboxypeptidase-like regulatory domain-containing protein [Alistipes senegalensis]|nr:carboxypeptidase-like regulatory domain-containing protein [Bacteroides cellulosilyticus]MCM1351729.1 carboxypeptidase-like regulatory domain-containing protein [Alistipes senegalensis]